MSDDDRQVPVIHFELEGIETHVRHLLTAHFDEIKEKIDKSIKGHLTDEWLQSKIDTAVRLMITRNMQEMIEAAMFHHLDVNGGEMITKAIAKTLLEMQPDETQTKTNEVCGYCEEVGHGVADCVKLKPTRQPKKELSEQDVMVKKITNYFWKYGFWFKIRTSKRVFVLGYNRKYVKLFSERYGYRKVYRLCGFSFRIHKNQVSES